ncbi:MAG: hypothetical protein K1X88_33430 [Nannocystaceae bacterium]|nr:hypothetical protein [Nannocystaceae bacterium]
MTIVDAGLGNLASVERALIQVGAAVRVSGDPDKVATARMVVFPGQGAFGPATSAIVDGALGAALRMVIDRGDPFLGICLGMQMLFDRSEENAGHPGLGILPGYCRRFPLGLDEDAEPNARPPLVPIMAVEPKIEGGSKRESMAASIAAALEGDQEAAAAATTHLTSDGDEPPRSDDGNGEPGSDAAGTDAPPPAEGEAAPAPAPVAPPPPVAPVAVVAPPPVVHTIPAVARDNPDAPLRRLVKVPHVGWNAVEPTGEHYYFVHSYYVEPERPEDVMWVTSYGGIRFPAAVRYQNLLGCQFHPEKSQRAGLKFLRAFLLGGWG